MRHRAAGGIEHQVDLSGDQVLHRRAAAAIRHERELRAGLLLEEHAADMRGRADTGMPLRGLVGIGLEPRDQLLEVLRRHRLLGDDHQRLRRQQHDRLEIVQHIVVERHDRAVDHVRRPGAEADGIAVRRGARRAADADAAIRAGDILRDHRLAERDAHAIRDDAADRIGRAAGRIRHDHRDRARGIRLRRRLRDPQHRNNRDQQHLHVCSIT